jgi:hypothetical protein
MLLLMAKSSATDGTRIQEQSSLVRRYTQLMMKYFEHCYLII